MQILYFYIDLNLSDTNSLVKEKCKISANAKIQGYFPEGIKEEEKKRRERRNCNREADFDIVYSEAFIRPCLIGNG